MKSYIGGEVVVEKMDNERGNLNLFPTLYPDRFCAIDIKGTFKKKKKPASPVSETMYKAFLCWTGQYHWILI